VCRWPSHLRRTLRYDSGHDCPVRVPDVTAKKLCPVSSRTYNVGQKGFILQLEKAPSSNRECGPNSNDAEITVLKSIDPERGRMLAHEQHSPVHSVLYVAHSGNARVQSHANVAESRLAKTAIISNHQTRRIQFQRWTPGVRNRGHRTGVRKSRPFRQSACDALAVTSLTKHGNLNKAHDSSLQQSTALIEQLITPDRPDSSDASIHRSRSCCDCVDVCAVSLVW